MTTKPGSEKENNNYEEEEDSDVFSTLELVILMWAVAVVGPLIILDFLLTRKKK